MRNNDRGRDQRMIPIVQHKEGMGNKGSAATTATITETTTGRKRPQKKDRIGSMQHPAGNTRENTFGENAHSMRKETTTKVITGAIITTITGVREIPMQAATEDSCQETIPVIWMSMGT